MCVHPCIRWKTFPYINGTESNKQSARLDNKYSKINWLHDMALNNAELRDCFYRITLSQPPPSAPTLRPHYKFWLNSWLQAMHTFITIRRPLCLNHSSMIISGYAPSFNVYIKRSCETFLFTELGKTVCKRQRTQKNKNANSYRKCQV